MRVYKDILNDFNKLAGLDESNKDCQSFVRENHDEDMSLTQALNKAKNELYPDKDYHILSSTEHDNVTIRARELMSNRNKKGENNGNL